jgi:hypothetical protein
MENKGICINNFQLGVDISIFFGDRGRKKNFSTWEFFRIEEPLRLSAQISTAELYPLILFQLGSAGS